MKCVTPPKALTKPKSQVQNGNSAAREANFKDEGIMNPVTHSTLAAITKAANDETQKLEPLLGSANKETVELAAALQSIGLSIARLSEDLAKALQAPSSKARSKAA